MFFLALPDTSKLLRAAIEGTARSEPERGADRMILLIDVLLELLPGRLPRFRPVKGEIAKEEHVAGDEESQHGDLQPISETGRATNDCRKERFHGFPLIDVGSFLVFLVSAQVTRTKAKLSQIGKKDFRKVLPWAWFLLGIPLLSRRLEVTTSREMVGKLLDFPF